MRGRLILVAAGALILLAPPAGADAAGSVVHFAAPPGEKETIFNQAGLKLKAACSDTGIVEVRPFTKRPKKRASIFAATAEAEPLGLGEAARYRGERKFHKGTDGFQLLAANPGLLAHENAVGTIVVADRKRVVAIEWLAESGASCLFGGIASKAKVASGRAFVFRENATSDRELVSDPGGKILAECAGDAQNPDLNFFSKTGTGVGSAYASSVSEEGGVDSFGYSQSEAATDSVDQLDVSGVEDDEASGTIVIPGSNTRGSILWVAMSGKALKKDCVFAGIEAEASAGDANRIGYSEFGPNPTPDDFWERKGLVLTGTCAASDLTLEASSSAGAPAVAHWSVISDGNLDSTDLDEYGEEDILQSNEVPVLSPAGDENAIGRLVYFAAGPTYVVANFAADEGGLGGSADCVVAGVASTFG